MIYRINFNLDRENPFIISDNINRLNCDFIMTPRILFNDENLSRTDIDLLSLIISLTLNSGFCFAANKYLASYINTSSRTITDSLSRLKKLEYIIAENDNGKRKIYINPEKIPIKVANDIEKNCNNKVAENCYHNINKENKEKYKINGFKKKGIVPLWMEHPELCEPKYATTEEEQEFIKKLNEIK